MSTFYTIPDLDVCLGTFNAFGKLNSRYMGTLGAIAELGSQSLGSFDAYC